MRSKHNYVVRLNLAGLSQVEVEIQYDFEPYQPGWFGPDGGEPPWGPEIGIEKIYVTKIIAPTPLDRKWLQEYKFLDFVEDMVWGAMETIRDELINFAEGERND